MKSVGIFEGKTHFSALVTDAEAGETTIITRNGKPVAQLSPIVDDSRARAERAVEHIRALRSRLKGPKISVRELIDEGRR
jgi:prevent-host-death family protein